MQTLKNCLLIFLLACCVQVNILNAQEVTAKQIDQQASNKMGKAGPKQLEQLYTIEKGRIDSKDIIELPLSKFRRLFLFHSQGVMKYSKQTTQCLWRVVNEIMHIENTQAAAIATYLIATGSNDLSQQSIDHFSLGQKETLMAEVELLMNRYQDRREQCFLKQN